jgi:hypothetical protein
MPTLNLVTERKRHRVLAEESEESGNVGFVTSCTPDSYVFIRAGPDVVNEEPGKKSFR